jgi:hypothetical protein
VNSENLVKTFIRLACALLIVVSGAVVLTAATTPAPAGAATAATTTQLIDPYAGSPTDVSCASATFCVAVDRFDRSVTYNGTTWSVPVAMSPDAGAEGNDVLTVSCVSSTFCAAVTTNGDVDTFNGTTWTAHANMLGLQNEPFFAISCTSVANCVIVDDQDYAIWNGATASAWAPALTPDGGELDSLSCPSATTCVAVDTMGNAISFDGASWSAPVAVVPADNDKVSCASTTFCVASGANQLATYDGSTWSTPVTVGDTDTYLSDVACGTATSCAAVDLTGGTFIFGGTTWTQQVGADANAGLEAVSCGAAGHCVAIDEFGGAIALNGTTWTAAVIADQRTGGLTSLSCPTASFCAAVDQVGNALTFNGTTWSSPHTVDARDVFSSVSCASAVFCAAVGGQTHDGTATGGAALAVYNGTTWTSVPVSEQFASISCPTATFCLALGWSNDVLTYNGTTWTVTARIDLNWSGGQVTCLSATFCQADGWLYNGTTWTGATQVQGPISCATTTFCVIAGGTRLRLYNGSAWSLSTQGASVAVGSPVSCPTTSYCAVAAPGVIVTTYVNGVTTQLTTANGPALGGTATGIDCSSSTRCVLINDTTAALWGTAAPVVTTQPADKVAVTGTSASFSAAANGTPAPTVQWQTSADKGVTWTNLQGATSPTLTVTASAAAQYRAVFTNSVGSIATRAAALTLAVAPKVTTQPISHGAVKGARTTFTAAASGTPAPSVDWQSSVDNGLHWTAISGATTTTLSVIASVATSYRAVFSNLAGSTTTAVAKLSIWTAPVVTKQPVSLKVTAGKTATFTATASGLPTPTVQWQRSTDAGAHWAAISSATATTYSLVAAKTMTGYRFRAVFTNAAGTVTTAAAVLTVA